LNRIISKFRSIFTAHNGRGKKTLEEKIVDNKELELKYVSGKGAWTYHIEVPDTKQISGPWGSIKVRGTIDGYDFGVMNLMPLRDKNAIMSINAKIRKSIGKGGGDKVVVTMWLLDAEEHILGNDILAQHYR
jgi:hypothetical protein